MNQQQTNSTPTNNPATTAYHWLMTVQTNDGRQPNHHLAVLHQLRRTRHPMSAEHERIKDPLPTRPPRPHPQGITEEATH
jgi:hypothetical protein